MEQPLSTSSGTGGNEQPFRFMDLPAELRLMVYERIPRTIKHFSVASDKGFDLMIASHSVPVAVLATSKTIHNEASAIILGIARTFVLNRPIQIVLPFYNISLVNVTVNFLKLASELLYAADNNVSRNIRKGKMIVRRTNPRDIIFGKFPSLFRDHDSFESSMKSLPENLRQLVHLHAYRLKLAETRNVQIVIAGNLQREEADTQHKKFRMLHEHTLNHNLHILETSFRWMAKSLQVFYAGLILSKKSDTHLRPNLVPQGFDDVDFTNAMISTLGVRNFPILSSMSQGTWAMQWLASSL